MHVDNELVEFVPTNEQDYEEIIEEYEEEVLIQEGALDRSLLTLLKHRLPMASLGA